MPSLRVLKQQYETLTFQDRGFTDWWFDAGVGTGKTFIASRWVHRQLEEQAPHVVGFIGANTYDQLNQAVLPPLLGYLEEIGIGYAINKAPPKGWGVKSRFPKHDNILTLDTGHQIICKFMKRGFSLPGIEIGWHWVDEIGDVPEEAFMILKERRRQPGATHLGLVTGTPSGPTHFTFRWYMNPGTKLPFHGSVVAKTIEGVRAGYIPMSFYNSLAASYSKRRAQARLEGAVVDPDQLRAYESHDSSKNCKRGNPFNGWRIGAAIDQPLGVFCDFNVEKVCIWTVGQFSRKHTHILDEIALETTRVETMMFELFRRYGDWYPGFHFFGDASGRRTELTSGMACYDKIKQMCQARKIRCAVTVPRGNGLVVDRLEAMNASLCAYDGTVRLTYDELKCPHLHLDFLRVGTDGTNVMDGGDPDRTHSSDGVGYHVVAIRPVRGPARVPITGHGDYNK